jgi:hypothetical protein
MRGLGESAMDESRRVIRFKVDGRWTASEFAELFKSLSDLYSLGFLLEVVAQEVRDLERFYDEVTGRPARFRKTRMRRRSWPLVGIPNPPSLDEILFGDLSTLLHPDEQLAVYRLRYGSPGFGDFAGIGEAVGHVKDFTLKLIERHDSKRHRQLQDEDLAADIQRKRIENARAFVALAREAGYSDVDLRRLIQYVDKKQDVLVDLVEDRKLLGVAEVDG